MPENLCNNNIKNNNKNNNDNKNNIIVKRLDCSNITAGERRGSPWKPLQNWNSKNYNNNNNNINNNNKNNNDNNKNNNDNNNNIIVKR